MPSSLIEKRTRKERERLEQIRMECRANRHTMRPKPTPPGWVRPHTDHWLGAKKIMHKRCQVCSSWRHIAYTHRFTYLTSYYDYSDGYLQDPGEGKVPTELVRKWEFEQVEAMEPAARKAG